MLKYDTPLESWDIGHSNHIKFRKIKWFYIDFDTVLFQFWHFFVDFSNKTGEQSVKRMFNAINITLWYSTIHQLSKSAIGMTINIIAFQLYTFVPELPVWSCACHVFATKWKYENMVLFRDFQVFSINHCFLHNKLTKCLNMTHYQTAEI